MHVSTGTVHMRWALDTDQLRSIEFGLKGKLRAAQISQAFIDRHAEDLVQQALAEYTNARERGDKIVNPGGWIVHAAYMRAIDQLRRDQHEVDGLADDVAAAATDETAPLPEEEALGHIEAEQLHRAISRLSVSQRQALSLYYFEEKSTRDGADALGWSEPTFRRRRDAAIQSLRERLGVSVPEFDIGLAAWLSLATTENRIGWTTNLAAATEAVKSSAISVADRGRELATRLLSSGGGETAIGISSPAGKAAAGICATAIAACTATGVVGPGVAGLDLIHPNNDSKTAKTRPSHPPPPRTEARAHQAPTGSTTESASKDTTPAEQSSTGKKRKTADSGQAANRKRARSQATSQFGVESSAPTTTDVAPPASTPAPQSTPTPSSTSPPDQAAQQQFGLP